VSRAVVHYLHKHEDATRGVLVGYDCRFMSDRFAQVSAEEIASHGIPVHLAEGYGPTPALSFAVRARKAAGAVMITASHNPWRWNGLKFKASYGGSAGPEIVKKIEAELPKAAENGSRSSSGSPDRIDVMAAYLAHLRNIVDLKSIAKRKFKL